jgi:hypothetical protein
MTAKGLAGDRPSFGCVSIRAFRRSTLYIMQCLESDAGREFDVSGEEEP